MIIDYNPSSEFWVHERVLGQSDCDFFRSWYIHNPYLSDMTIREIEKLKNIDPDYWRVYGLGLVGSGTGLVYPSFAVVDDIPSDARHDRYGLDYGYANDPTALVRVSMYDGYIYLDEMIYATGMTNVDIADRLADLGIDRHSEIIADSAEPKSIEDLYRRGYNVKPSIKSGDSIRSGIDRAKQYPMRVTRRSVNLIKELRNYRWAVDKQGKPTNRPIDDYNHALDAVRYALSLDPRAPRIIIA
jgi:phage terminase large subunit